MNKKKAVLAGLVGLVGAVHGEQVSDLRLDECARKAGSSGALTAFDMQNLDPVQRKMLGQLADQVKHNIDSHPISYINWLAKLYEAEESGTWSRMFSKSF